jgi:predicted PurR-regulated permease PerM
MLDTQIIDLLIRVLMIGLLGAWCFALIRPFLAIILWGAILAIALFPIFLWLKARLGGRAKLSATLIVLLGIIIIVGPISFMATTFAGDAQSFFDSVKSGTLAVPPPPEKLESWPVVGESLSEVWQTTSVNVEAALVRFGPQIKGIANSLLTLAANTSLTLLKFLFSLIIAGLFMVNSETLKQGLIRLVTRVTPSRGQDFLILAADTVRNVTRGVIGVAILQTLLIGIGLNLAGIPAAGLLTLACLVLSVIQVGPGLVVFPCLIYVWSVSSPVTAIIFTIWMIPATLVDNILKPILMARGLPVPMLVILIGVLGGTLVHGLVGLFVGPVILALGYELVGAWLTNTETEEVAPEIQV